MNKQLVKLVMLIVCIVTTTTTHYKDHEQRKHTKKRSRRTRTRKHPRWGAGQTTWKNSQPMSGTAVTYSQDVSPVQ